MAVEVKSLVVEWFVKVVDELKAIEDIGGEYGHEIIED